ncbi:MAG TPA: class I tRNA ligase family protein, partial [Lachnospiraceae bacterium]|nr:class I tRNA ligase family protein [Lachnospiraceae bacterium]
LVLLNPVASHMTEELWDTLNYGGRLYQTTWPQWEEAKTVEDTIEIAVQINGKVKDTIKINTDEAQDSVKEKVFASETVQAAIDGKSVVKEIYVKGKIYNIVVK